MNLTVIMIFSSSVFLCYVPDPYLLNDWKLIKEILVLTALLVSITVYIEPLPRER